MWQRARLAVGERLPLWLRLRCGVEPKALYALCVVLVVAAGFAAHHYWTSRPQAAPMAEEEASAGPHAGPDVGPDAGEGAAGAAEADPAGTVAASRPGASPDSVVVDVAGKVRHPGLYTLPSGSRVADAIEAAGGSTPGTDTDGINRARLLADGEQILVGVTPTPAPAADQPGTPPGATNTVAGAGGPVSINTASADQLQTLPGVGPVLAQHIIDYRAQQGSFTSVEQLQEVSGIGDRRLADLRDHVTL